MTNTKEFASSAFSGIACGRCSRGRDQVRHADVAAVRACFASVRDTIAAPLVPVVTSVVDFVPAAVAASVPAIVASSVWVSASGSLVRVRKARGGAHLLAAELVGSDEGGVWEYRGGASRVVRQLRCVPASAERVALFGHRSGSCVFCSRQLDDERSLAAGYGPVCAGKFGLAWG